MRKINEVIVHCAFTPTDMDIGAAEIKMWHTEAPRNWSDIGYHYVIRRDGTIETGRPLSISGAHARGHNANSIGICLVGGAKRDGVDGPLVNQMNFTLEQMLALNTVYCCMLDEETGLDLNSMAWTGNYNYDEGKDCPLFDVHAFVTDGTIMEYVREDG